MICGISSVEVENKKTMDILFKFLADFYGVKIEEENVPYKTANPAIEKLEKEIADWHKDR